MEKVISLVLGYELSDKSIKALGGADEAKNLISRIEASISEAGHGEEFTPHIAIRNMDFCLASNYKLRLCLSYTIRENFIKLASLGLLANTPTGEAHVIAGKNKKGEPIANLRIGVGGHCKIIQRVFPKSKIYTKLLSVADKVSQKIQGGKSEINIDIDFEKNLDLNKKENIRGVYISLMYDDYLREEIIPINYINDVDLSRNNRKPDDIWTKHYGAMATKTALIKFSKDLVVQNQSKFPEVFFKALDAESETSGFPPLKKKEPETKVETKVENTQDIMKELEEMSNDEENFFG